MSAVSSSRQENDDLLVETSAILAVLLEEPDAEAIAEKIDAARCVTTATNFFEAVLALAKQKLTSPTMAHAAVASFVETLHIEIVPFTPAMLPHAIAARERFGRGRHKLNMGDCLSYAAAKQLGLTLLYKGDDFARTDVNDGPLAPQ